MLKYVILSLFLMLKIWKIKGLCGTGYIFCDIMQHITTIETRFSLNISLFTYRMKRGYKSTVYYIYLRNIWM